MKRFKRLIASLLTMLMLLQPIAFAASVSDFLDFPNDWSTEAMTSAVDNGLFLGNDNKLIQPGKALTRAELAAFVTRAFGATAKADISHVTDVSPDDWFYEDVAKAYQMGAITGTSDTTFSPNAYITRQEVFLVLARALCLSGTDASALDRFTDKDDISDWARNAIIVMSQNGYVNGYPDGSFKPLANITRAELAQVFHNIFKTYIDVPGYHTSVANIGSVMIRTPGVHLENVVINGDLVISDGVGAGDFDLSSVTVNGKIILRGGEGKVTFKNVTVRDGVIVYDQNGIVNFNNYRTDAPFRNFTDLTGSTFLKEQTEIITPGGSTGGNVGGGGTTTYYTVIFNVDGEEYETKTVKSGQRVNEITAPAKTGYTFKYWSETEEGEEAYDFSTPVRYSFELYAIYEINKYDVTFYEDTEATTTFEEINDVEYKTSITAPDTAPEAPDGKTFVGWALKGTSDVVAFPYEVTSDTEFVPVFTDKEVFTVTFFVNDAEYTKVYVISGEKLGSLPADPTSENKMFSGWFTGENGTGTEITADTVVTENMTVYAYFVSEKYTVNFYNIALSDDPIATLEVAHGETIDASDIPEPTSWDGFERNADIASIYGTLGIDDKHVITNEWWYVNGTEWDKFDETVAITGDLDIYDNSKFAYIRISAPNLSSTPLTIYAPYNDGERAMDTFKDIIFINENTVKTAFDSGVSDKLLSTMVSRGIIDNTTDKNILNQKKFVKLIDLVGKANLENFVWEAVGTENQGNPDYELPISEMMRQFEEENSLTVNSQVLFILEPILDALKNYDFEFFKTKIPEKALSVIPVEAIETLYNRFFNSYITELETAITNAKADPTGTYYVSSGINIEINPVTDILAPMLQYVKDMKAFAEGQLASNENFDVYYQYYENNPYKDAYEEYLDIAAWVDGTDNGYEAATSGYSLKSFDDYYGILKALALIIDDGMSWYYDDSNVPQADRDAVLDVAEDKVLAFVNMVNGFIVDYAVNGFPSTLTEFVESIESDPTMLEYLKKYGLDEYLTKLEDNATAGQIYESAYEKFEARFGARIEAILDRYVNSALNRVYGEAEYEKAKTLLHGLFTGTADEMYSINSLFDIYLGGADSKEITFRGITAEFFRAYFLDASEI